MPGRNLIELFAPSDGKSPEVDFVAVHGLKLSNDENPAESTWTHDKTGINWLKELLPDCVKDRRVRVMAYTYDSNPFSSRYQETLKMEAKNFLNILMGERDGLDSSRPIFMIGYSLGGILIKQALVTAKMDDYCNSIYSDTYAVTFMGTPHKGAKDAGLAHIVANVTGVFYGAHQHSFLEACQSNSLYAREVEDNYRELFENYFVYTIYETERTKGRMVVTSDSARLDLSGQRERVLGVYADHLGLSKFPDKNSVYWKSYRQWVSQKVREALESVRTREELGRLRAPLANFEWFPINTMMHLRNNGFIGREREMSGLRQFMSTKQSQPRVALWGASGTGKTSLAVEYCYRLQSEGKHSIFWVSAKTNESIITAYEKLAVRAKLSIPSQTTVDEVCQEVRQWLESPRSHCWTMILDGMDDRCLTSRKFLPTRRGAILVTTRQREVVGDVVDPNRGLEVKQCNLQDAKDLLESRLGAQARQAVRTSDDIELVCRKLDFHPLALVQAGDFIRNKSITISEFLRYIEEKEIDTETFFRYSGQYTWDEHERPSLAVMTTWNLTFNSLVEEAPSALRLLEKISLLSDELIPGELIHGRQKSLSFTNDMAALINYSLVFNMNFQGYRMHRLVAFFTRKRAELDHTRFCATVADTIDITATVYPKEENGAQVGQILPHALKVFQHAQKMDIVVPSLKTLGQLLAKCLLHLGSLKTAREHIVVALRVHDGGISSTDEDDAAFLEDAARVFWQNDEGEEVLRRISQVVKIYQTRFGHSDARTLKAERRQAKALDQLGQHRQAIATYEAILRRIQNSPEPSTPEAFSLMNSIGHSYLNLGEWQQVLHWQKRAHDGYLCLRDFQGGDDNVLEVKVALARAHSKVHQFDEAHEMLQQCEDAFVQKHSPNHIRVAMIKEDRAEVFMEEGRYDKAISLYLEALAGYDAAKAFTGKIANNIGEAYKRQREFDNSMRYFRRSLKEKEKNYGRNSRSTIISIRNLGDLFEDQNNFTSALQWYKKALSRSERLESTSAPGEIHRAKVLIARVLLKLRRYEESSAYCRQALEEAEELYGTHHEKYYENERLQHEINEEKGDVSDQEWDLGSLF